MKKLSALLLVLFCAFALVACAPKDSAKAKDKMEDAGYSCTANTYEATEAGAIATITGTKTDEGESIISKIGGALDNAFTATLYESSKQAKAAAQNSDGSLPENTYIVGKWVFVGNEEAYKAFKAIF